MRRQGRLKLGIPAICVCAEVAPGAEPISRIKADVRFSIKASSSESSTDGYCINMLVCLICAQVETKLWWKVLEQEEVWLLNKEWGSIYDALM